MRLGKYELRSPVIKYVDIDLDEKIYNAIRASIGEDIAKEVEEYHRVNVVLGGRCDSYCNCLDIANHIRGQK